MKRLCCLAILLFSMCQSLHSQEIMDFKFGKGLLNFTAKDSSFKVKFAPRIQFRSNTSWTINDGSLNDPQQNFLIRRARLKFDGWAYSPKLEYKIELGLSNRDISGANPYNRNTPRYILDAVLMWNFYENFEFWAGQTKLPGNVERVISSANLQLVDRSILNSFFNIDRDVGIQLRHFTKIANNFYIREKFALSQGEGRNVTQGNLGGLQYTGRLEMLPFGFFANGGDYLGADLVRETSAKLMLGLTYDYNDNAVKTRSNLGDYMVLENGSLYETDITTIFADAMFKYNGISVMAEYAHRNADEPLAMIAGETNDSEYVVLEGDAFNVQAGYLFDSNYEIAGRFSTVNFDATAEENEETQYTFNVSKYIVGHKLKVQTDLSYRDFDDIQDEFRWRIGFDFHF